jgi:hypothetical protein
MDDRMVEQFVDEDDFIIKIDFDNQLGHFELTLFYWRLQMSTCMGRLMESLLLSPRYSL